MSGAESMDGLVLSDVHMHKEKTVRGDIRRLDSGNEVFHTEFKLKCLRQVFREVTKLPIQHCDPETAKVSEDGPEHDEDGDIIVPRRQHLSENDSKEITFNIYHSMATPLDDVGLQVWMGSLVMVDYILDKPGEFRGRILELGGGVGLTSLVLGMVAQSVTLTDIGHSIQLCEMNYKRNFDKVACCNEFQIFELDWRNSKAKIQGLSCDVIVACDVVYDNDITDAFFRTLYDILQNNCPKASHSQPPLTTYISLEKRLNFTMAELNVTCKEYDHFRQCLEQLRDLLPKLSVEEVDTSKTTQHCDYFRTGYLEIWKLQLPR